MDTYTQACTVLEQAERLPELVVFDLDYTLWPFYCEMLTEKDVPCLYPEALHVLRALRSKKLKMALASRTPTPNVANIRSNFESIQLIPASSGFDHTTAQKDTCHFPSIHQETGIEYNKMLFFDDERRNIQKVSKLGVVSLLVSTSTGIDVQTLQNGLELYAKEK